jgi:DnaK suppressor protein
VRKRDLERCRKILLEQREHLLGNAQRMLAGEINLDPDDFPDEIDAAVSESNLSFTGQLREREGRLLNKVEKSLEKFEQGTYGECESCGDEIEIERLRARPVAALCIACKDEQERLERRGDGT